MTDTTIPPNVRHADQGDRLLRRDKLRATINTLSDELFRLELAIRDYDAMERFRWERRAAPPETHEPVASTDSASRSAQERAE